MTQGYRKRTLLGHGYNRREMLLLTGVAAAASLVEGAPEQQSSQNQPTRARETRLVRIDARPGPIVIDTTRTAVIVVDMQNDFGAKGGMLDLAGIDISMIQAAVGPTAKVLASARESGMKVVYLKMAFRPDLSDVGPSERARLRQSRFGFGKAVSVPDGAQGRIMIRDTWNTEILPALKPQPPDMVIYKHRFSGFYRTELDDVLKQSGIRYLIFTGCTTSVCVESTLRDAMFRDYDCVALADCTGEPVGHGLPSSNHEASLFLIQTSFGWVSGSSEFVGRVAAS
jgi:ureidoacrylate peracid hydrolase